MLNSIVCALNGFTCSLNDDRGDRKRKFEKGAPWDANEPALRSWIEGHDEMQDWMRDFEAQETKPPLCKRCTNKIGAAYRRVKKTRRASAPASLPVPTPPPIDVESGIDIDVDLNDKENDPPADGCADCPQCRHTRRNSARTITGLRARNPAHARKLYSERDHDGQNRYKKSAISRCVEFCKEQLGTVANGTIDALGVADMCRSLQGGGDKLLDADFLAEVSVSCNMSKQDLRKFRAIARERLGANACASEHDEKAARTTHRKDFGLETHFFDDPTIGVDGAYIDVVAAIEKLIETRDPKGVHTPDVVHICFSNDGTDHGKAVPHSLQGATFRWLDWLPGARSSHHTIMWMLTRTVESKAGMAPVLQKQQEFFDRLKRDGIWVTSDNNGEKIQRHHGVVLFTCGDEKARALEMGVAAPGASSFPCIDCLVTMDDFRLGQVGALRTFVQHAAQLMRVQAYAAYLKLTWPLQPKVVKTPGALPSDCGLYKKLSAYSCKGTRPQCDGGKETPCDGVMAEPYFVASIPLDHRFPDMFHLCNHLTNKHKDICEYTADHNDTLDQFATCMDTAGLKFVSVSIAHSILPPSLSSLTLV